MKKPEILLRKKTPESSNIKSIVYQPALKILQVSFKNGRIYWYYNVPREIYDNFIAASSKGEYFHKTVKDKFTYKRIKSL